jgi:hypothetical protein
MGLFKKLPKESNRLHVWLSNGQDYILVGYHYDPNATMRTWVTTEDGTRIRSDAVVAVVAIKELARDDPKFGQ